MQDPTRANADAAARRLVQWWRCVGVAAWLELLGLDELQALASADVGELAQIGHYAHVFSVQADAHIKDDEEEDEEDEEDYPKLTPALALGGVLAHDGLLPRRASKQFGWDDHGFLSYHVAGKMRAV
jgi:hypothetical protein